MIGNGRVSVGPIGDARASFGSSGAREVSDGTGRVSDGTGGDARASVRETGNDAT